MTPLVRMALLLAAFGLALVGYRGVTSGRVRKDDLIARLWKVEAGDSKKSVERKLGRPVRTISTPTEQFLWFEDGGEGAAVTLGPEGVEATTAMPSRSDHRGDYGILGNVQSTPI